MPPTFARTLLWCLGRPRMYGEAVRKVRERTTRRLTARSRARETEAARRWCAAVAVDLQEALAEITGRRDFTPVAETFADELAAARRRAADCPVAMGGAGNLDLLYHLAEHAAATRIVETGVAYGWSSLILLLSLERRHGGRLMSIDRPYPGTESERFTGCAVPERLRSHWSLVARADRQGLPLALREMPQIDLCHYDSDKTRSGREWAYPRLWQALRPGGLFASDDVGDNLAFRDFAATVGERPRVIRTPHPGGAKYVGVLIKRLA